MPASVELVCFVCKKIFLRLTKQHNIKKRRSNNPNDFCSQTCFHKSKNGKSEVSCENCGTLFLKLNSQIKKTEHNFCSCSCAATFNNRTKTTITFQVPCRDCGIIVERKYKVNKTRCAACISFVRNNKHQKKIKTVLCQVCGDETSCVYNSSRKYCDTCRSLKLSEASRKSVIVQAENRRSKNEIYFAELCQKHFNNVKTNVAIFNGWDADVILDDMKVAVLWNGKWHYEEISKKYSLLQIQTRDKIKIGNIVRCGYIPYVIKDMGKHSAQFVEEEFNKFLLAISAASNLNEYYHIIMI